MKRKIKKIIAGILFASMLTGNVSMNVVYGTENYGDRIEENQSANIEDGGKQFTEEDNTQNQNQNKTEDGLNEDQSSVNTDATEGTEQEVGSDSIKVNIEEINPAIKEKLKTIVLAVWTEEGQRDLQWIEAEKISDNQYEVSIKMDLFNNAKGKYYIDVRAVEFTDVEYVIGSTECKVE